MRMRLSSVESEWKEAECESLVRVSLKASTMGDLHESLCE